MKNKGAGIVIAVLTILVTVAALEGVLRYLSNKSEDETVKIAQYTWNLHPPSVVGTIEEGVAAYMQYEETTRLIYDPYIGWVLNPNHQKTEPVTFTVNSAGMREMVEYDIQPSPDILRIAVFGDSFTAGDDADDDKHWAYYLEETLAEQGIQAEVLNFGVGGYGMDQAYLRWQHEGKLYSPDIVIFGFQPENMFRNVNIFRAIYRYPTYSPRPFPLTKPRYILNEDNQLELINSPTIPPEQIVEEFRNFNRNPLHEYEYFYVPALSKDPIIDSKIYSLIVQANSQNLEVEVSDLEQDDPILDLARAIVDAFAQDVKSEDSTFIVLHLPWKTEFAEIQKGNPLSYESLFAHFDENNILVRPEDELLALGNAYLGEYGHYSSEAHYEIALLLAEQIKQCQDSGGCEIQH